MENYERQKTAIANHPFFRVVDGQTLPPHKKHARLTLIHTGA